MFHLWIGVMAGTLLAYVWTHAPAQWRQATAGWWFAIAGTIVLLIPIGWDLWRTSAAYLGPIESIKSVLLPWVAGFGFGIWAYLIAPQAAPTSWLPLLVALVFVAVIVSEERYGWLGRLQKITIGGGGVEFAAAPPSGTTRADSSPLAVSGTSTGEGRIGALITFMTGLPRTIERDHSYAKELGYWHDETAFATDLAFARNIIMPLGTVLDRIHKARGYNDIGFLIGRPFVDNFRAYTQDYLTPVPPAAATSNQFQSLGDHIEALWLKACDVEFQLRGVMKPISDNRGHRDTCIDTAKKAVGSTTGKSATVGPNPLLPYGTLLSAMLLNAAGEVDLAVKDLDLWVTANEPKDRQHAQWLGIYRARYLGAILLTQDNPTGSRLYRTIRQYKSLVELGQRFLSSTFPSNQSSWRTQMDRLEKGDRIDSLWHTAICALDLSSNFKRMMLANLNAANNLAYFLSQDVQFAKHERLLDEMEKYGFYISGINVRCLQEDPYSDEHRQAANRTQATFLDTAAAVEVALALREDRRGEKRTKLCRALKHMERAIDLQRDAVEAANTLSTTAVKPAPWQVIARWQSEKQQLDEIDTSLILSRRLERVQAHLSQAGMDC